MNLTVDASVFVAASRPEEAHYLASRQFLQQARVRGSDLFCPLLVLPECAAAIARATDDATLAKELALLIEQFPKLQLVPMALPLAHRAVQIATDHRLRGADSVYISVAETFEALLITWDAEMLQRGSNVVRALTPLEWLQDQVAVE
jgi:predicted nucleic acid-binding protein